ncbi:hypothetical protein FRC19_007139 [Serendipita sp. 401]|nr:hypothetical protein FRC19_007139 [Serendipita sp. 401]KAG9053371.1 hypothetical protein FS842_008284 [Serendipita sp. 407]
MFAALRRERNVFSPVNRLPKEILGHIFSYNDLQSTIQASAVCSLWRTAAIGNPRLWTCIDMSSRVITNEMAQLILERSGDLPLDVRFRVVRPLAQYFNAAVPDCIADILARARSVSNLVALSENLRDNHVYSAPIMSSLHTLLLGSTDLKKLLRKHQNIRHLSVFLAASNSASETRRLAQIDATHLGKRLRTLHLSNISLPPSAIQRFLVNFASLEELSFTGCSSREVDYQDAHYVASEVQTRLWLLSFRACTPEFVVWFLHPDGPTPISPTTNLLVDPTPEDDEVKPFFGRQEPATFLYIDFAQKSFTYAHENAMTRLIRAGEFDPPSLYFPSYIPLEAVRVLSWSQCVPLSAAQLESFGNLSELSFSYHPGYVGSSRNQLSSILNVDLVANCPNLTYLEVKFRRHLGRHESSSVQPPSYKDDSEVVVTMFLEAWNDVRGSKFGCVSLRDEVKPQRWSQYTPVLQALTNIFEVVSGMVVENEPIPFPELRQFHADSSLLHGRR